MPCCRYDEFSEIIDGKIICKKCGHIRNYLNGKYLYLRDKLFCEKYIPDYEYANFEPVVTIDEFVTIYTKNKEDIDMTEQELQKMIESGEIGTMTECAYGSAIADSEKKNTIDKKKKDTEDIKN